MPFIEVNLNDAKEKEVVPEGAYDLRIIEAPIEQSKNSGKDMIVCLIGIESTEYPNAMPVREYYSLPHEDDTQAAFDFKLLQLRRLCDAFNVPFEDGGFNSDDLAGATASEIQVRQESFQPKKAGTDEPDPDAQPFISNKVVLPRLRTEEAEKPKTGTAGGKKPAAKRR